MEKQLQILNFEDKKLKTIEKKGIFWWVLKDVCEILGLSNPSRAAERLEDDEKTKAEIKFGLRC
jgi:prophage antirepressor-like protein